MIHPLRILILFLLVASGSAAEIDAPLSGSPFATIAQAATQPIAKAGDREKDNSIIILNDGRDALLLRVHLIRSARRSINLQTFIWQNDECGRLIMYELIKAAKRGVEVRIIVDHFVSNKDPDIVAFLATAHPNLKMKHYRPGADRIKPSKLQALAETILFFQDTNQRMHNKIITFDDSVAILGGRNYENPYYGYSTEFNFKDRDVAVIGPLVPSIVDSFGEFWAYKHSVSSVDLKDVAETIEEGSFRRYETRAEFFLNGFFEELERDAADSAAIREKFLAALIEADKVEFLADAPGKRKRGWLGFRGEARHTQRLIEFVGEVKSSLLIQSPYLVISKKAKRVFLGVKKRNPDAVITISTNSFDATDNIMAYSANYRLRTSYIGELGFRIYEFKAIPDDILTYVPQYAELQRRARANHVEGGTDGPYMCLHAKSFVADDRVAYIGSYNLDPRSGNLNTEVGLLIEDPEVVDALKENILNDIKPGNSWVIAKREIPLAGVNSLLEGLSGAAPVDLWPVKNTSSFELIPGMEPVPPDHESFNERYRDVGSFPGTTGLTKKEIITRIFKAVGKPATPLL